MNTTAVEALNRIERQLGVTDEQLAALFQIAYHWAQLDTHHERDNRPGQHRWCRSCGYLWPCSGSKLVGQLVDSVG